MRLLSKTWWENYHFLRQITKIHFKMWYITECKTLQNWEKSPLLIRSEKGIFEIVFKRQSEDLKTYKSIVIENIKPAPLCPIKWRSFNIFVKSHESALLIANIVKSTVSGLTQVLATKSPWRMMKNAFYYILKALFVVKMFKSSSWLFGHAEKTVWLER